MRTHDFNRAKRPARSGYGLVLLTIFLMSTLLLITSIKMMSGFSSPLALQASESRQAAEWVAMYGLSKAHDDIITKLQSGTAIVPGTYSLTGSSTTSNDASNSSGTGSTDGTYTVTITKSNGYDYLLSSVGKAGNATVTRRELVEANSFSCASIDSLVFGGSITAIADAKLQRYAQNNCMLQDRIVGDNQSAVGAPPNPITATPTNPGCTPSSFTASASGQTLNLNPTCAVTINDVTPGTLSSPDYDTINIGTVDGATAGGVTWHSAQDDMELYVSILQGGGAVTMDNFDTANNTNNLYIGTLTGNGTTAINGGAEDDHVEVYAPSGNWSTRLGNGTNDLEVNGGWGTGTYYAGNGTENISAITLVGNGNTPVTTPNCPNCTFTKWTTSLQGGNANLYFSALDGTANALTLYTGTGSDRVACSRGIATATPGAPYCTGLSGTVNIYTNSGDDYIFLDTVIAAGTTIDAGSGLNGSDADSGSSYNIVYIKGMTGGSINIGGSSGAPQGKNLLIVGGNVTGGTITVNGTNNVLLKKTGITFTPTLVGSFTRTISY